MSDVIVNAQSKYIPELSKVEDSNFYYLYEVSIENKGKKKVKLLTRHWDIYDGLGKQKKVDGEGVVGKYPIISPGEIFKYKQSVPVKKASYNKSSIYEKMLPRVVYVNVLKKDKE